jgi:hypothetical protein
MVHLKEWTSAQVTTWLEGTLVLPADVVAEYADITGRDLMELDEEMWMDTFAETKATKLKARITWKHLSQLKGQLVVPNTAAAPASAATASQEATVHDPANSADGGVAEGGVGQSAKRSQPQTIATKTQPDKRTATGGGGRSAMHPQPQTTMAAELADYNTKISDCRTKLSDYSTTDNVEVLCLGRWYAAVVKSTRQGGVVIKWGGDTKEPNTTITNPKDIRMLQTKLEAPTIAAGAGCACSQCNSVYTGSYARTNLLQHVRLKHAGVKSTPVVLPKTPPNNRNGRHVNSGRAPAQKQLSSVAITCQDCGVHFTQISHQNDHQRNKVCTRHRSGASGKLAKGTARNACVCGEGFQERKSMTEHKVICPAWNSMNSQLRTTEMADDLTKCTNCSRRFNGPGRCRHGSGCRTPRNSAAKLKPQLFECEHDCGFEDPDVAVVEVHEALCSNNPRKHVKGATRTVKMVKVGHNMQPATCPGCGHQFTQRSNMDKHRKMGRCTGTPSLNESTGSRTSTATARTAVTAPTSTVSARFKKGTLVTVPWNGNQHANGKVKGFDTKMDEYNVGFDDGSPDFKFPIDEVEKINPTGGKEAAVARIKAGAAGPGPPPPPPPPPSIFPSNQQDRQVSSAAARANASLTVIGTIHEDQDEDNIDSMLITSTAIGVAGATLSSFTTGAADALVATNCPTCPYSKKRESRGRGVRAFCHKCRQSGRRVNNGAIAANFKKRKTAESAADVADNEEAGGSVTHCTYGGVLVDTCASFPDKPAATAATATPAETDAETTTEQGFKRRKTGVGGAESALPGLLL